MHLKLDDEIVQIEHRIAGRKQRLSSVGRATGKRSLDVLASPLTLAGALALGFAVGGGLGRRRTPSVDRRRAAKAGASGLAGLALSGAMWLVKHQFGGPAGLARMLVAKLPQRGSPPA